MIGSLNPVHLSLTKVPTRNEMALFDKQSWYFVASFEVCLQCGHVGLSRISPAYAFKLFSSDWGLVPCGFTLPSFEDVATCGCLWHVSNVDTRYGMKSNFNHLRSLAPFPLCSSPTF